MEVPHSGQAGF